MVTRFPEHRANIWEISEFCNSKFLAAEYKKINESNLTSSLKFKKKKTVDE
jgi:hypothetical protein